LALAALTTSIFAAAPVAVNDPDAQGGRYQVTSGVVFDSALLTTPSSIYDNDAVNGGTTTYGFDGPHSNNPVDGTTTITTSHGATVLLRLNGTFTYTPAEGFTGNDNFFYNLTNGSGNSRAQVLFTVIAAPPTVASLSPTAGSTAGGTSVTISGSNFLTGNTSVTIGGTVIPAASVTVNTAASLTFSTPAHAASNVAVTVTTPGGTSGNVPGGFTYTNGPAVSSLSPAAGPTTGGTSVTIAGTNFVAGNTSVTIDSTVVPSGSVTVNNATSLTFSTPAHAAGNVIVTVTTPSGTSNNVPGGFTYTNGPNVSGLSPITGSTAGGTSVTLAGTSFIAGNTSVTIGGTVVPAASVTVNSATSLTFSTPAHAAGVVDITVTTPNGTSATSAADQFTYVVPPVAVSDGPANYVTTVNHTFSRTASGVLGNDTVNGATIASYGATTGTEQTAIGSATPTAQGGSIVLNADGSFSYTPLTNFSGSDTFKYKLTNGGGSSTATVTLYVDVLPTVTSTVPANNAPGVNINNPITINFSETISTFQTFTIMDTTSSSSVAFTQSPTDGNASSTFTLTPSAALTPGHLYTVTVLANQTADVDGGLSMASNDVFSFTALPAPTVLNDPDTQGGRYQVTSNVPFDSAPSSIFDNDSSLGTLTVTYGFDGPHSNNPVDGTTTITTSNGGTVLLRTDGTFAYTSAVNNTGNDNFFYNVANTSGSSRGQVLLKVNAPPPAITSISPTAGPVGGGTTVIITGSEFTGASGVKFGGTNAASFTVNSNTQITAKSPAGALGAVDVTVITPGGTSPTSTADKFIYENPVAIGSITRIANGTFTLQWSSTGTLWYQVSYSSDMIHWTTSPPVQANSGQTSWTDTGPPVTNIAPNDPSVSRRFYILKQVAAP
jgi:methionine-rich copper-binding protein CopC